MEIQKEKVPSNNALFYCKQNNEYSCLICTLNETYKDWMQHEETSCHIRTLERFYLIFTLSTNGIVCKVCGASLKWEILRTHAHWHKIVPWYKPTDRYKTFFRNRVIEWESEFYCYPCNQLFPEWSTAYIHTRADSHQKLLEKWPAVNDFACWMTDAVPYDILVSEGFVSNIKTVMVECTICNCWNISLKNVLEHVKGQQHLRRKVEFMQDLNLLKSKKEFQLLTNLPTKETLQKRSAGHSENSEDAPKSSCENIPCIYIVKQARNEYSCEICDLDFFSPQSVDLHIKETRHLEALKKYGCEQIWLKEQDYIFHCKCCDCPVLGIKNVHQHVRGVRHKNSLSELKSSSSRNETQMNNSESRVKDEVATKSEGLTEPGSRFLPHSHIENLSIGVLLCHLCDELILNVTDVQNHITGKNHVYGVEQLAENIVFKEGNTYHCKCCNCMISGLDNVYGHINGYIHANSSASEGHKVKTNDKNSDQAETSKQSKSSPKTESHCLLDIHIEKLNSREFICNLCGVVIPNVVNIQNHLAGKKHVFGVEQLSENIVHHEDNNYHCKCCNCMIPDLGNVYGHINSTRHTNSLSDIEQHKLKTNDKNSDQTETSKQSKSSPKTESHCLLDIHIEKLNSREFICNLCGVVIPNVVNIQNHLAGKKHVFGVEQLSENIVRHEDNNYHCKCCNCMIPGVGNVYRHINSTRHTNSLSDIEQHKLKTNDKNSDQTETSKQSKSAAKTESHCLLDIHVEKLNSREFICNLCGVVIPNVVNIQNHLAGKKHVFGVEQLSEKIVHQEDNGDHRKCGNSMIPGPNNIYGHTDDNRNAKSPSATENRKEEAGNTNLVEIAIPKTPEIGCKSSSLPNYDSLPKDHMKKLNNTELYCKLCDETLSGELNLQKHLKGTNHVFGEKQLSENISFKESNNYHCKCCNCMIPGLDNIYVHIKGNGHAQSLNNAKHCKDKANDKNPVEVTIPKQPKSEAKTSSSKNDAMLPKDHIEKRNSKESQCRLCNEAILGDSNIQKHLTSKIHVSNDQQLSENIFFVVGNNYQCKCCDCVIPGIENIYPHINGIRHVKTLRNFERLERNLNYKHVAEVLASSDVDDHRAGKQHAESLKMYSDAITTLKRDKYDCKHCKLTIYGIDKVNAHLQEIRHKTLSNKAKKTEKRESPSSSDYIAFQAELDASMRKWKPKLAIAEVDSPPENIPCQFCGVFLPPTSDRHSHLATHVGEELFCPEEPEKLKETKEHVLATEQKDQNGNLSQVTAELEKLQQSELSNNDSKVSFNSIRSNGTIILANHTDSSNSELASAKLVPAKISTNPEAKRRSPKKSSTQRIAQFLNPEKDFIHDMVDKLRDTELGMKLCSIKEMKNIYCLICRKEVPETVQNYYRHLGSADHCEYLEGMEKDHALFELVPEQLSELDLVCQYMDEVSESYVRCHACDSDVENTDMTLKVHINDERHVQLSQTMNVRAKENFEDIKSRLHCDWYTIHEYWCVPCSEYFQSELTFAKHVKSTAHSIFIGKSKNGEKVLIHDFCSICGLLWFGTRCTYANHCESTAHKLAIWKSDHESQELSRILKIFLAEMEQYIGCAIKHFDQLSVTQRDKEETLIRDLEMAVKSKFSDAKAFLFGSKASGFRTGDSDVEIFLDCGNMYDGVQSSEYESLYLMTTVHQCLYKDPQSWDVNKMITACRSSVLKARHYTTGLTCEISFENGLVVENTKLIMYFNNIFPPCRKLILFLYQWLTLSGLKEPKGISNNALYWYMIFYLQKELSLPSVGSLIAATNHSHTIAGWEVGVSSDFSRHEAKNSNLSIRELLINFFTFYVKFDYRYDVVSPLIGREVKKRAFADPQCLPKEMAPYINYLENLNDPSPFRIDSAMCVQDPFILQRNLTENVSKAYLSRFRACCFKSLDVLRSTMNGI